MIKKLFNRKKLLWTLIITLVIIIFINIENNFYCDTGFPFKFLVRCIDLTFITISTIIYGYIINSLFWFIIVFISISFINFFSRLHIFRYILTPLYLTIISFFYYEPCRGFICFFPGHGFPLGYFNDYFSPFSFFIDFLLIMFFYFLLNLLFTRTKKKSYKNETSVGNYTIY